MSAALRGLVSGKRWIAVVVVAALIAGGATWWFANHNTAQASDAPTTRIMTATASTQTLQKAVSATGTLTPAVQEDINFAASGKVTSVAVKAGETVTKGQKLATIDTTQLDVNKAQAALTLAQAQEKVASAKSAYTGSTATQAALDLANAQLASAQEAMDSANDAMADATLTSPVAGLVTAVNLTVGQSVNAGSSSNTAGSNSTTTGSGGGNGSASGTGSTGSGNASAQITVIGTGSWIVNSTVSESDVAKVKVGSQVTMTSDSSTNQIFGTVQSAGSVASSSSSSSGSSAFPVVIAVTGSPAGLHDGVSVTASIIYSRRTDVLTVPTAAITTTGGVSTVMKVRSTGKAAKQTVTTGETSGTVTEITKGLSEGDKVQITVVTGGQSSKGNDGETFRDRLQNGELPDFGGENGQGGGQMPGGENGPGGQMPGGNMQGGGVSNGN